MDEKFPKAPLLRSREDHDRMGIEFLGGDHGGQTIKISIGMSRNYFHNQILS
jgi:hypothetical protein